MQKIFKEVTSLDKRCYKELFLSEDILMESAGRSISDYILKNFPKQSTILIISGGGNNGADGVVVARQLHKDYRVKLFLASQPKSEIGKLQLKRASAVGVKIVTEVEDSDVVVDAIFGSGFQGELSEKYIDLISRFNSLSGFKIACDLPSGVDIDGGIPSIATNCDITITMGAMKLSLLSDEVKDLTGSIVVADLGVSRAIYETHSIYSLLEKSDLKLPIRKSQYSHKGSFGHSAILSGEKSGASIISGTASLLFGSGLVTLVSQNESLNTSYELMSSQTVPDNSTVIIAGMGLGNSGIEYFRDEILNSTLPMLLDADIFHHQIINDILKKRPYNLVITPHPKEFQSILKVVFHIELPISEIVKKRIELTELFSQRFPDVVLLLKGANRVIAFQERLYFDTLGDVSLAKGGSGDILAGLIGSLLAQGYSPLDATVSGSLALSLLSQRYKGANYSLSPSRILNMVGELF